VQSASPIARRSSSRRSAALKGFLGLRAWEGRADHDHDLLGHVEGAAQQRQVRMVQGLESGR
jgi:hypothetical protein